MHVRILPWLKPKKSPQRAQLRILANRKPANRKPMNWPQAQPPSWPQAGCLFSSRA